jgi:membrane fusion protein, multidrug efflux system
MYADLLRRGLPATLVCAAAVVLAACTKPAPPPEPVRAVRTLIVSSASAASVREYAAEVRARTESRLGFRVAGKLVQRTAELGQTVRAGQVLARLDATDLKLGQDAALAASRAAQTNYELAAAEFKRYQDLRAQGFISGLELERREAALKAQQAQRDQALAQAGVQGNQAGYAALTAPAAGVITGVDAEVGAVLAVGAGVLRLAHDGPRDAVFAVPEDQLAGMRARLGKPGALKVRPWNGGAVLPATVREVAAAADPATRTYLVKADLGRAAVQLGQTVTVLDELPRTDGIVRLPLAAVMQQQGQTAVWVLDPARMTVQVQPVGVAGTDGNTVVVASGLRPGQVVVTAGVHALTPGQQVKHYAPPGATAASAASAAAGR